LHYLLLFFERFASTDYIGFITYCLGLWPKPFKLFYPNDFSCKFLNPRTTCDESICSSTSLGSSSLSI
jgi:hypothetical protein